jgi:Fe-S cluster assembly protein SufD
MSEGAENPREQWERRLRAAIMQSAPLLDARTVPVDSRSRAIERALAAGLPGLRDEAWRNADLRFLGSVALAPLPPAPADEPEASELPEPLPGFSRLVYSNGRLLEHLSDPVPELRSRAPALVPERTQHERFGWLNDAFATDVARLVVAGDRRLELLFLSSNTPDPQAYYPRLEVTLEAGASLVLAERHLGAAGGNAMTNVATQVYAASGSRCRHLRVQQHVDAARLLDTLQLAIDREARYELTLLQLGAASARTSVRAALFGEGAELDLGGVSLVAGRRTLDTSLRVDHVAPRTTSTQVLRALARDGGRIGCTSRVEVAATARVASSQQSLRGLLDGDGAQVHLQPRLQILTDDVRASHGATTGALDPATMFYLLSRGLDPQLARSLLEWAFLENALSRISDRALRRHAELAIATRLGSPAALEALQ